MEVGLKKEFELKRKLCPGSPLVTIQQVKFLASLLLMWGPNIARIGAAPMEWN